MGQLSRLILVLVPAVLVATPRAQIPKDPAFDVVAVKPAADPTAGSFSMVEPGELGPNLRRDENCDPGSKDIIQPAPGSPEPAGPMACGADGFNPAHLWARGMTLNYIVIALGRTTIDRVVVDHTGLTGKFDWEVQWIPEVLSINAPQRSDGPSIFQAFRDQLGLKLEPTRDRVDVLVIDHVQRPTPD